MDTEKEMRTATITFHAPNNNGSFLQAYALQTTLRKLNIENDIIDYHSNAQKRQYSVFRVPRSMGDVGRNVISMMHYHPLRCRFVRFENLRNTYLKMTKRCTTEEEVYQISKNYDAIICGSDQIWNTAARDFSDVYFMPDIKAKKIAYAASFGAHVESIDRTKVLKYINEFDAITVRENAGYHFLKNAGITNVEIVCDPTFLLDREDYEILISPNVRIKKPYIFLYTIGYATEALKTVQQLSEVLHIPVYTSFTGYSAIKCRAYGIKVLYDVSPGEFLNLIENASYVCSDSFHGVAFSIIFHKQFYRIGALDGNGQMLSDDRIDNLLNTFNLSDRILYRTSSNELKYPEDKIAYAGIDQCIEHLKKQGINYLKRCLSSEG